MLIRTTHERQRWQISTYQHAQVRIVFLGALIHYILQNNAYFEEYVRYYTNAPMLINDQFKDTEDLDGLFSSYDEETQTYSDQSSWDYERDEYGKPRQDPTMQHPRCVLQIMRRHYARYTPELVENECGMSREQWFQVAQILVENSGRERTGALCYAVGWTQQSKGVQIIRAGAMLQLLLGNIGRPVAVSWHCAGMHQFRVPQISRHSMIYCPVICLSQRRC